MALGKPARQSTGGSASRAVDGNSNSNYHRGFCTHTGRQRDPWWSVDLGATYLVQRVHLVNRGDCCSERLHDLNVYLMEIAPPSGLSSPSKKLCYHHPGIVGASLDKDCDGPVRGRYVAVQITSPMEVLSLCEVQVFENRIIHVSDTNFGVHTGKNLPEGNYLKHLYTPTELHCLDICNQDTKCMSASYSTSNNTCIASDITIGEATATVDDNAYVLYSKSFQ
ncbi:fucolectin-like [Lineus longissimus]|uniref:fucolectin-like n=1 Tax=Lineus longissimus TaxID=88925 RepID=UPI002B4EAD6A